MKRSVILLVFIPLLFGCQSWVEPALENNKDENSLVNEAQLAQQTLGHAYLGNPLSGYSFNDVATDDAVSNDVTNSYMKIATGQWRADNSPMNGDWQNRRGSIQYINLFISFLHDVEWSKDDRINTMFVDRMNGDAHGMRALFTYYLLLEHAGWTADGQLLGIPILTEPETTTSNFNLPRNTFAECIDSIRADVEIAAADLPLFYPPTTEKGFPDSDVPSRYRKDHVTGSEYVRVFGNENAGGRMNGAIAEAILAQAYLLAASPAYSQGSGVTWEQAANQMATVLSTLGPDPISQMDPTGNTWYQRDAPGAGINPKEILWRGDRVTSGSGANDLEALNFPPTLYGKGRLNPTQNLVDAFPMKDGYPINHPSSDYSPQNPYVDRDPRLDLYIIHNGSTLEGSIINTAADGTTNDAIWKTETSTRTGYYMRKLLRPGVSANPSQHNDRPGYKAYIRYTEIFLGYAEAANEAWGPQGTGGHGYSAYDVIKAIRNRAGITGDDYLESIKGDKDKMRELIHNERRLELCFEGQRFWDLRRWKASITEMAKGMSISEGIYAVIPEVEKRAYEDYMYYAPIPYSEILKFNALVQNKGW